MGHETDHQFCYYKRNIEHDAHDKSLPGPGHIDFMVMVVMPQAESMRMIVIVTVRMIMVVIVRMIMVVRMFVIVRMIVIVRVGMAISMVMRMVMIMSVIMAMRGIVGMIVCAFIGSAGTLFVHEQSL